VHVIYIHEQRAHFFIFLPVPCCWGLGARRDSRLSTIDEDYIEPLDYIEPFFKRRRRSRRFVARGNKNLGTYVYRNYYECCTAEKKRVNKMGVSS
jgi:hypothetical protein